MQKHLFFVCPTDNLESVINFKFKHENYFLTSLGNSFEFNKDNVNEINIDLQPYLLNLLRNTFLKIENENIKNIRFIVSSSENLIKLIEKGQFREDLFYYLNIIPLYIPPLRERKEDIKDLVDNFLNLNQIKNLPIKSMHNSAYKELENYSWPGNIKELETFINRLVILSPGKLINEKFVKSELDKVKELLNNDYSNFSEKEEKVSQEK